MNTFNLCLFSLLILGALTQVRGRHVNHNKQDSLERGEIEKATNGKDYCTDLLQQVSKAEDFLVNASSLITAIYMDGIDIAGKYSACTTEPQFKQIACYITVSEALNKDIQDLQPLAKTIAGQAEILIHDIVTDIKGCTHPKASVEGNVFSSLGNDEIEMFLDVVSNNNGCSELTTSLSDLKTLAIDGKNFVVSVYKDVVNSVSDFSKCARKPATEQLQCFLSVAANIQSEAEQISPEAKALLNEAKTTFEEFSKAVKQCLRK